jgi:hypothetical protein
MSTLEYWTVCYQKDVLPPKTAITLGLEKVSPPGNVTIAWKGVDPWNVTPEKELLYSYRLDEGPWSIYSEERNHTFLTLKVGHHKLEVRTRDRDFNTDPSPAVFEFEVLPPVWRQPWFISMIVVMVGTICIQTLRLILRDRRLAQANQALENEVEMQKQLSLELQANKESLEREIQERQKASKALESNVIELREALNQIKTLHGIVPICAGCKKIRDDRGFWEQVESYVTKHSHAQFSHSMCPECMKRYYPELVTNSKNR